jgi:hypothetical protein
MKEYYREIDPHLHLRSEELNPEGAGWGGVTPPASQGQGGRVRNRAQPRTKRSNADGSWGLCYAHTRPVSCRVILGRPGGVSSALSCSSEWQQAGICPLEDKAPETLPQTWLHPSLGLQGYYYLLLLLRY